MDQAGDSGSTADDSASPGHRRGLLTGYLVPVLLVAVAVAAGIASYVILPDSGSVAVQGAIQRITVEGPLQPTALDVTEFPDNVIGGVALTVTLRAPSPPAPPAPAVSLERLVVALPTRPGTPVPCPPGAIGCTTSGGARTAYFRFPAQPWTIKGSGSLSLYQFAVDDRVLIPAVTPNLDQDAEHIAAALPPVSVLLAPAAMPTQPPTYLAPVPVDFGVRAEQGDNYTWSEGVSAPVDVRGLDTWDYTSAANAPAALNPVLDSGTNLPMQDQDSTATFLAGALLGIAGGALVGAVPEFIRARRESREQA